MLIVAYTMARWFVVKKEFFNWNSRFPSRINLAAYFPPSYIYSIISHPKLFMSEKILHHHQNTFTSFICYIMVIWFQLNGSLSPSFRLRNLQQRKNEKRDENWRVTNFRERFEKQYERQHPKGNLCQLESRENAMEILSTKFSRKT